MGEAAPTEQEVDEEFVQHGVALEAFNMKEELDDGVVDPESGVVNPRKSRGQLEQADEPWLLDFDEKMKDKEFAARFKKESNLKSLKDGGPPETIEPETIDKIKLLTEISNILLWGETVNTAFRRLRPGSRSSSNSTNSSDISTTSSDTPISFNDFLDYVDKVMIAGVHSIYDMTKEDILDELDSERKKFPIWEYKWSNEDETIYGPHSTVDMQEWLRQGYFQSQGSTGSDAVAGVSPLMVRKCNGASKEFVSINSIDFGSE
eukprot:TRINITY_DN10456_c0_g1_i1.p1 TRINITY_DN10456_c0_g1~~TRINITY_DN10456_c0_g1_i1.p1  ORF type:complete len:283 (-),score=72.46 TRINITY_DN10456_c0_g1_i1:130-915(-)